MQNELIIRKIEQKDIDEVFTMMKVFYASPAVICKADDEILMRDIKSCTGENPYIEGFVFVFARQTAGYAMTAKSFSTEAGGITLWVEDLYIKPEFRQKGIGTKFFKFIEDYYAGKYARLRLEVEAENRKAINVYQKCGYHELPYIQMIKE